MKELKIDNFDSCRIRETDNPEIIEISFDVLTEDGIKCILIVRQNKKELFSWAKVFISMAEKLYSDL